MESIESVAKQLELWNESLTQECQTLQDMAKLMTVLLELTKRTTDDLLEEHEALKNLQACMSALRRDAARQSGNNPEVDHHIATLRATIAALASTLPVSGQAPTPSVGQAPSRTMSEQSTSDAIAALKASISGQASMSTPPVAQWSDEEVWQECD
mmetsp:Transcript_69613/g.148920  ORF Transcript_69613/g.148920 Transcript_69613/m.148920 type:complete len:155 (+) Transcript_69613:135-599(+)